MCACLFLCVFLSGCAITTKQRDATETFGLATERVGRIGEEEFITIRDGIIQMNETLIILDRSKTSRSLPFDEPAQAETTALRLSTCKSLRMYGDLLMRLASDDRSQFVRRSALSFMDSVSETLGTDVSVEQEQAVNSIVAGFDTYWTENKRVKAIRDVVLAYEGVVNSLADRLLADFSLDKSAPSSLQAYEAKALQLQSVAGPIIDAGDKHDLNERKKAVEAYFMAESAHIRAQQIGARIHVSILTLKQLNTEIASGLRGNSYNLQDIKDYGRQIQKISNLQQVLSR